VLEVCGHQVVDGFAGRGRGRREHGFGILEVALQFFATSRTASTM